MVAPFNSQSRTAGRGPLVMIGHGQGAHETSLAHVERLEPLDPLPLFEGVQGAQEDQEMQVEQVSALPDGR